MKTMPKIAILVTCTALMLLMDLPLLHQVSDAEAIAGVRRRTARRTAVVVGGTTAAATSAANQQAAYAQQQAAAAEAEAAAAQQQAAAAGALPIGTVVTALPAGCTTVTSGGVEYHRCGADYYRAAFQGSQLVYVTAQP